MRRWPTVSASIRNVGSRPADDALVKLIANGPIRLSSPPQQDDDEDVEETSKGEAGSLAIPRPRMVPRGHRHKVRVNFGYKFSSNRAYDALVAVER